MILRPLVVFTVLLSCTFSDVLYAANKVTLRVCSLETGFGIYTNIDGNGIWQNIVKESVKGLDVDLVFTYAPRARCLLRAKKNDVDAVYAAVTNDRKDFLNFPLTQLKNEDRSRAIGTVQYKIYKQKSSNVNWDGKIFTNLAGNSIGVQRGLQIEQTLRDNKVKVDGDLVSTPEQNLTKLHMGRIVAAAVEEVAADDFIKSAGFSDIVKFEKSYSQSDVYLSFSNNFFRKHQALSEKIWDNVKINRKKIKTIPAKININSKNFMAQL